MDKKLLDKALKGFLSRLEKTEKFVLEQAPDICKEIVKEEKLKLLYGLVPSAIGTLVCLITIVSIWNHDFLTPPEGGYWHSGGDPTRWGVLFVLALCSLAVSGGFLIQLSFQLQYLNKCTKLFLLRKFKDLID